MKIKIIKILSKPKIIIPISVIIGAIILLFGLRYVGQAPIVNVSNDNSIVTRGDSIDLSFVKSGKLENVSVSLGQYVKKGDVIARLSSPDALGAINQAKGALNLAQAEYASLNSQYQTTKKQQDQIVENNYNTLLSSSLDGEPSKQTDNDLVVSGTYTCGKEGNYKIKSYRSSDNDSGYSFVYSGLENGVQSVKYENAVPLGNCGLSVKFVINEQFDDSVDWSIDIPNTKSTNYILNKNNYDLSIITREKILSDLAVSIGDNNEEMSISHAKVLEMFLFLLELLQYTLQGILQ